MTLTPQSAIAGTLAPTAGTPPGFAVTVIAITSFPNACSLLDTSVRSSQSLLLEIASAGPLTAGTYGVPTPSDGGSMASAAFATYDALDPTCLVTSNETTTSGSITITAVSSMQVTGTFDLTLPTANGMSMPTGGTDHVTGSFAAPYCSNLTTLMPDGGIKGCQ
jgi:hypothetical protein